MLVNLSEDKEILKNLAGDEQFVEVLLSRITDAKESNANLLSMLLANLAKYDPLATSLMTLSRDTPKSLSTSPIAIDQLLDLFVKGAEGSYNKDADYDYLSYLFADMSKHSSGRAHFLNPRKEDGDIVPLSKTVVFTEHKSDIRRRGVASTIKNASFDTASHDRLLNSDVSEGGLNLLPYVLLPLMGPEDYADEDTEGMLEEVQLLPPDKEREKDGEIVKTHLETLLLLTTTREGRDLMRKVRVYPIVRELHLHSDDEGIREGCDRLVQIVMRDEEGEKDEAMEEAKQKAIANGELGTQEVENDEDDEIVEVL